MSKRKRKWDLTPEQLAALPDSRQKAIAAQSKVYFTGNPCPHGHRAALRTHNSECTTCSLEKELTPERIAYLKTWAKSSEGKKSQRYARFKTRYKLSKLDMFYLFSRLNLRCDLCEEPFKKGEKVCVDHNHKTKAVRGLLHDDCNLLLSKAHESLKRLDQAKAYLQKHNK